jgi:hypothetical protein
MLLYMVVSQLVAFMEEHLGLLSTYNHELNLNQITLCRVLFYYVLTRQ